MQIVDNKALRLKLRNPQQVLTTIPESRAIGPNEVLVKWDVPQVHRLRSMNIDVPSPIQRYNWPGKYKPFEHQKVTAEFLVNNQKAFCFSSMGTGKTASAIWAADFLMTRGIINRALILCPVSIMDAAWRADLFSFAMHRKVDIAHGSADKRRKVIASDAEFVIINFDGTKVVKDEIANGGFDLIIVDEASAYKTATTQRWKTLKSLIGPDTWLWMMTGTPAAQGPQDAYGLAKLVNPAGLPRTFTGYRDMVMYKVTQFKWEPKPNATDTVHQILQPAIRFAKEDCLDLPEMTYVDRHVELTPQQKSYYNKLRKQLLMQAAGETVTAANAAVAMNKLLQISCISVDTPVLCERGWVPIQDVLPGDRVWDGVEWVRCDGAVRKGTRETIKLDGVRLTEDHMVLTVSGWVEAKECVRGNASGRFDREKVRTPYGDWTPRVNEKQKGEMDVQMRLWKNGFSSVPVSAEQGSKDPKTLRMSPWEHEARDDKFSHISHMDWNATTVFGFFRQGLEKLRTAWDNGMSAMGGLSDVLQGYGGAAHQTAHLGPCGQQWSLLPEKLQVGDPFGAVEQQAHKHSHHYPKRGDDHRAGGGSFRNKTVNAVCKTETIRVGGRESLEPVDVYDVLNCGPRSRFVVRGEGGQTMIVHNCGAVYTDDGNTLEFDIKNRYSVLKEVVDESANKVIVFVPFQSSIEALSEKLNSDGVTAEIINGSVPAGKRTEIFKKFQTETHPQVLVVQPQAAAHGVTLTAADTIVWWSPTPSLEIYSQANARIHRSGQKNKCTVVKLGGSAVERKLYGMLDKKLDAQSKIIKLYEEILA